MPDQQPRSPSDWEDAGRRTYARRQAELAAAYELDVSSHVTSVAGYGQVHYLEAGHTGGKPVVLLHGIGTPAATWLPMLPALADQYRLLVPDRPGIGLSDPIDYGKGSFRRRLVDYLPALLEELGVSDVSVVGNSLGGLQAFLLALDTDFVGELALLGAPAGLTRSFPLPFRLLTMRGVDRFINRLTSTGDPVETARNQIEQIGVVDSSAVTEPLYRVLAANSQLEAQTRSLRTLNRRAGSFGRMHPLYDISDAVTTIEVPTSFIWGDTDAFFDPDVGRPVVQQMANASFRVLPEHGHMPWLEPTDEAGRTVAAFLGSPSAGVG